MYVMLMFAMLIGVAVSGAVKKMSPVNELSDINTPQAEGIATNFIIFHQAALQWANNQAGVLSGDKDPVVVTGTPSVDDYYITGYSPLPHLFTMGTPNSFIYCQKADSTVGNCNCSEDTTNYLITYVPATERVDKAAFANAITRLSYGSPSVGILYKGTDGLLKIQSPSNIVAQLPLDTDGSSNLFADDKLGHAVFVSILSQGYCP